jgi:malonate-semialdehyde dehydrogenase (acetylating)/methylmalonate-semialdehyde dehydrogenase
MAQELLAALKVHCTHKCADLVIDGRGRSFPGREEGFFLWPTLIDHATKSMKSYQDEIFGPVLQIVRSETSRR